MAAADIVSRLSGLGLASELIEATVSDGETVTSKLSKPLFAFATAGVDDDGEINCVISSRTITINAAGMTDKKLYILVFGRL